MRENKKNNKGFSLVELIVVIAIMIVLVAVLAPVFTKYVEQSRRATDIQNAATIASAVLVQAADDDKDLANTSTELTSADVGASGKIKGLGSLPEVKGNAYNNAKFYYHYDPSSNTAIVQIGDGTNFTGDLSVETNANTYKNAEKATSN